MNQDEQDREDAQGAERTTIEEARASAGADEGIEPTASTEADEPSTALADRERLGPDHRSWGKTE